MRAAQTPVQPNFQLPRYSYEWTVTIPARETRRLLHYVVRRPGPDTGTAGTLASLEHPAALAHLTAEELATIVNFAINP